MNRFFKKDKAPTEENVVAKKPKKGKKVVEEVKPDFDLSFALPKVDDFRTSLIMPGLSTRFSMLREQDDPNSLLGKACDDSVLQPKHESRLHEFGFNAGGLSDIAEVSSLRGSVRPPFAGERPNSFDTNRSEDDSGSMMTRARPGEGNVLFGGRQKIYMISNNSTKGLGRTLYDDDVNMSTYQRLRLEEREKVRQQQAEEHSDHQSEPTSPTALSQKRETSSSTNSGPTNARTSTAATSIASQGISSVPASSSAFPPLAVSTLTSDPARSTTKVRRLYDQGLDQHIQDQQSSAINRLNSLQRGRALTGRSTPPLPMSQAKSATNLSDRFQRGPASRSDSPKSLGHPDVSRNNSSAGNSPAAFPMHSPPPASPASESEESFALQAALQPYDRGKATAMGAFNKPKEAFSEHQYEERLKQMQQEREVREVPVPNAQASPPRKPTLRERAVEEKRRRADTGASERQRSDSSAAQDHPTAAFSVFQAAASQMRTTTATPSKPSHVLSQDDASPDLHTGSSFLNTRDSSDDETSAPSVPRADVTRRFENLPVATGPAPSIFEHPALRACSAPEEKVSQANATAPSHDAFPELSTQVDVPSKVDSEEIDSPTLGPNNSGLGGLIRQHLRNDSNLSSNYGENDMPAPSSAPTGLVVDTRESDMLRRQPGSDTTTSASNHTRSNPWDLDDIDNAYQQQRGSDSSGGIHDGHKGNQLTSHALSEVSSLNSEHNARRNHERIASNETEADHEAFQRDLAYRQRLIQENLRVRAEGRSTSPAPGPSGGLRNALNLLRAKSSHESFATVERGHEAPNKVIRKLALGANSANVSSASLASLNVGDHSGNTRLGRHSPPASSRSSMRERSSSGASSGRSRGRSGHRRENEHSTTEDLRSTAYPPAMPGYIAYPPPPIPADIPSIEGDGRMRSRSNSRPPVASQLNPKHLQPIQTKSGASPSKYSPISPRPSPGGSDSPYMSGYHSQTSPMPPFSAGPTPPASNPATPNVAAFNASNMQPIRQNVLRKKSIAKSDISEPVFLSTTSVIDLVNLPPGASLKNGAEADTPPVPPINPMRKRFGFGRSDNQSPPRDQAGIDSRPPFNEPMRTNSDSPASQVPQFRNRLRKASSEGKSLHGQAQVQIGPMPAMPSGNFVGRHNASPHPKHDQSMAQRPMDGSMF
ncbi:hypothetical protein P153DRAFT_158998 [Dothidotthia symphoricarpi CBS 119687]|uniref:Uncharacterized protein n=1 Tax=Dothidotthia symphoricarpi CBS 119687 TaxID=1392245 RepID=A0A6A6AP32_9PLEO|nr:uncharacterized protein P153DRAFT_158998 [Dothidotthia symphoricarpi CBS 119687]KAF2133550.1 hypothetical protein P153DRAFT_158998 [Dothidotthia symphoricarpi CBS 119687]